MRGRRQTVFDKGYRAGYERGKTEGYEGFGRLFDGTSIIIPTYNKKELLLQCLDSIETHTPFPYELIVVDDGSNDGTYEALRRKGRIRVAVHERNQGFAAAVNTGLIMAKGQTVLILNNDVIVTERWLENMLLCLHSAPDIGAVGPVTNYIGGEQQIEVPYRELAGMREFAARRNRHDPGKWKDTERLVGFCLLLRREVVQSIGFFDEGFRIGNYEDDDWSVRLRLLGWRLVIAGDSFIHHLGSETMRSLDTPLYEQIQQENHDYFHLKWGQVHERLRRMELRRKEQSGQAHRGFTDQVPRIEGCPVQILVSSGSGQVYWLDEGRKYRIRQTQITDLQALHPAARATRLSRQTLRAFPLGGEWDIQEAAQVLSEAWSGERPIGEGTVVRAPNGEFFQIDQGAARLIWSEYAAEAWGLTNRARGVTAEQLAVYPEGWPILPPVRYHCPGI